MRGNALQALKRHEDALCNRGSALQALKRYPEALASFDRALAIKPDLAVALSNRGNVLHALSATTRRSLATTRRSPSSPTMPTCRLSRKPSGTRMVST